MTTLERPRRTWWILLAVALLPLATAQPQALESLRIDTDRATIAVDEVRSGGPPPQGIPALGFAGDRTDVAPATPEPRFVPQEEAAQWVSGEEPVIVIDVAGEQRLYPLQILTWHEIANDTVGGVPVAVTFCPLCNSALAFDRRLPLDAAAADAVRDVAPGVQLDDPPRAFVEALEAQTGADAPEATLEVTFGVSGLLYNSNLLMFDDTTRTLWAQITGEAAVGTLAGARLLRYPAPILAFADARAAHPDAPVLSRDTGFQRNYGRNPYVGYDDAASPAFLFAGEADERLPPKERVVTFELGGEPVAYPFSVLQEERVVHDRVGGEAVVVLWQEGTRSALDAPRIDQSADVGAANAFRTTLDGRELRFEWDGDGFVDAETGSRWNLLGEATDGPLSGSRLEPIVHDNTLWFAWAAFKPETRIHGR